MRHELAGLRLVVEREVQPLQVREEPLAEIGLRAPREPERGVPAKPHTRALHDPDREDQQRVPQDGVAVAGDDPLVDRVRHEQRHCQLRERPHQRRDHAEHEELPVRAHGVADETPSLATEHAVAISGTLCGATHRIPT